MLEPDYADFIPAMDRRRMSPVIKMSIACSLDCLAQAGIEQPGGIIVGTSMGCSVHTKNFLDKIHSSKDQLLAPTHFIVSTHNTIAGQISLLLRNDGYNITHTQNSLSFEQSLLDGILSIREGFDNILVGGTDEAEETIYNMKARLGDDTLHLTSGSAFFLVSSEKKMTGNISLVDVGSYGLMTDPYKLLMGFLESNKLSTGDIDLVLYAGNNKNSPGVEKIFSQDRMIDYQKLSGVYFTNSAFAMHYGIDLLLNEVGPVAGTGNILIWNNLIPENLGFILLSNKTN